MQQLCSNDMQHLKMCCQPTAFQVLVSSVKDQGYSILFIYFPRQVTVRDTVAAQCSVTLCTANVVKLMTAKATCYRKVNQVKQRCSTCVQERGWLKKLNIFNERYRFYQLLDKNILSNKFDMCYSIYRSRGVLLHM